MTAASSSSPSSFKSSQLKVISPDQVSAFTYDAVDALALEQARPIVTDVKTKGLEAVRAHAHRLGDLPTLESKIYYTPEELKTVYLSCSDEVQQVLHRVASRIRAFATLQRASVTNVQMDIPGGQAGQDVRPVLTAGCYAPGGRYPVRSRYTHFPVIFPHPKSNTVTKFGSHDGRHGALCWGNDSHRRESTTDERDLSRGTCGPGRRALGRGRCPGHLGSCVWLHARAGL